MLYYNENHKFTNIMKKFLLSFVLLLVSVTVMVAEEVSAYITVNGLAVTKTMSEISFDQDDVVIAYSDGTSAKFSKSDDIEITFNQPTSVEATQEALETFTYGGIVGDELVVSGIADGTSVVVYAINGVNVASGKVSGDSARINVSGLTSGVYILRAGKNVVKFIKK